MKGRKVMMKSRMVIFLIIVGVLLYLILSCTSVDMRQYEYENGITGLVVKDSPNIEILIDDSILGKENTNRIKAINDGKRFQDVVFERPIKIIMQTTLEKALKTAGYNIIQNDNIQYYMKIEKMDVIWNSGINVDVTAKIVLTASVIDKRSQKVLQLKSVSSIKIKKAWGGGVPALSIASAVLSEAINESITNLVMDNEIALAITGKQTPPMIVKKQNDEINNVNLNETEEKITMKTALIIGNGNYSYFPTLANPISEAKQLEETLLRLGFLVISCYDGTYEDMLDVITQYEIKLKERRGLSFFHYGGHGVQIEGTNYMIPINANIPDEGRVRTRAVNFQEVVAAIESSGSKTNILILDACRDNPLPRSTRSGVRGLTITGKQPPNSILVYSAEANTTAMDGVFTPTLVEMMNENPNIEFSQLLRKVRAAVWQKTKGTQMPGEYNQLINEIYLNN